MENIQNYKPAVPRPKLIAPTPILYIGQQNYNNKNYFLNYGVIKDTLEKGLHPKYLSSAEKEVMVENEGGGWYDKWVILNQK